MAAAGVRGGEGKESCVEEVGLETCGNDEEVTSARLVKCKQG